MIKAPNQDATLSAIIFIHDVYMSLLEQNHQERAGIQEPYKMYKMYEMYKEYEMEGIWDSTVFAKESEADHFLAGALPPCCDSRRTWEPVLAV